MAPRKRFKKRKLLVIPEASKTCLSPEAAQHVYEAVQKNKPVDPFNTNQSMTLHSEETANENPYTAVMTGDLDVYGNADPFKKLKQSEFCWSVLSTEVCYKVDIIQGPFTSQNNSGLYQRFEGLDCCVGEVDQEYCDRFEEVSAFLSMTKLFNECSEVTTTHLWRKEPESSSKTFRLEGEIPLPHNCVTEGSLPDGTKMRILFDTGATRSFMSKNFYMRNRQLHTLPKFTSPCKAIMVGSGQCVSVLFVIPIIASIGSQVFEIFTTVCDIHDGMDLVFGMQNMIETEGEMSARDGCYQFISRSIPIIPMGKMVVQPGEVSIVRVEAPFCEPICGTGVAKFFCRDRVDTLMLRLVNTRGIVRYKNTSSKPVTISPDSPVGIMDLQSLGYFKVKYKDLVSRLSPKFTMYRYMKTLPDPDTEDVYLRTTGCKDPYPWLESDDPR